jgi:hypothetical protein
VYCTDTECSYSTIDSQTPAEQSKVFFLIYNFLQRPIK